MARNESMQRFTAHAANSLPETRANYASIMQTARELGFEMPHMQALREYVETDRA